MKVFKGGKSEDLQKQWLPGMLQKVSISRGEDYSNEEGIGVDEGRKICVQYGEALGDLWKLIDLRMLHNGNQGPPFPMP